MVYTYTVGTITIHALEQNLAVLESTLINMLDSGAITLEVADQLNSLNRASTLIVERILKGSK